MENQAKKDMYEEYLKDRIDHFSNLPEGDSGAKECAMVLQRVRDKYRKVVKG
ncbi:hypothetical protein Goe16_01720 [Bacillus phage vB_BsuM-Goe16]|nr:hypothetical protein Goe16_01720 [Bacillus phage vB_BsuM-Goe16]